MRSAPMLLAGLALFACRSVPGEGPRSVPRLGANANANAPEPRPQVLVAPADQRPLSHEPGNPMAPISEADRRAILRQLPPVFAPYTPPPDPIVIERHRPMWEPVRDFPLFHTLAYAGLGAIIGNQFDHNSGRGAAIGASLGFLHDQLESDLERQDRR
ncbi:MAG: hypothetical protein U1E76_08945 [Planctomycetota bacterium]